MLEKVQLVEKVTLKELRTLVGQTQEDFAKFVSIPITTYRRYEADPRCMEVGTLFDICKIVGVPIEKIALEKILH